jgi:hypothetical protein
MINNLFGKTYTHSDPFFNYIASHLSALKRYSEPLTNVYLSTQWVKFDKNISGLWDPDKARARALNFIQLLKEYKSKELTQEIFDKMLSEGVQVMGFAVMADFIISKADRRNEFWGKYNELKSECQHKLTSKQVAEPQNQQGGISNIPQL